MAKEQFKDPREVGRTVYDLLRLDAGLEEVLWVYEQASRSGSGVIRLIVDGFRRTLWIERQTGGGASEGGAGAEADGGGHVVG